MDLERLIICVLMMSGHLNSAFVALVNIRSHTELWFSNQSIPLHYHVCYSPCYDVMSMLVSPSLGTQCSRSNFSSTDVL